MMSCYLISPFSDLYSVFLDLELGRKRVQKSLGAFSADSCTWRLSRVRVVHAFALSRSFPCHAYASFAFYSKHAVRVSHAFASMPFRLGTRPRHLCVRVAAFSSKLHFCMFSFCPLSHSCPMRPENT
ncbi:uncharacterized protein DS421_20g700760 [Arachis hypogaea]|nr:uncharacterized protein DS421_20g700760 [Arachis hypogaea]